MVFFPLLANECVWRETAQGLEPAGEIVGCDEVREVAAELVVRFILSTWPFVQGCFTLVKRCSIPFSSQTRPKM